MLGQPTTRSTVQCHRSHHKTASDDGREHGRARDDKPERHAPTAAKAVAFVGPTVLENLLPVAPYLLWKHFGSGAPIPTADYGKPVADVGAFTLDELRRIGDFARAKKVDVPVRASAFSRFMPPSPMAKAMRRLSEKLVATMPELKEVKGLNLSAEHFEPHIELSTTSIPVAMHEIGHATTPLLGQTWRGFVDSRNLLALARPVIAVKALLPPDDDASETRKFVYNHAPALMAATSLPTLLEEGRASLHALRGAREFGPGVVKTLKELVPAYGTYVAGAAAPALAIALAQRLATHLSPHRAASAERQRKP